MKVFIVAIPLFDASMTVEAYYLRDRSGDSVLDHARTHSRMQSALTSPGLSIVAKVGVESFAGDCPLFVSINRFQLLTGMPTNVPIPADRLVVTLPGDLPVADTDVPRRCEGLRRLGYRLAFDAFPTGGAANHLMEYMDFILLDFKNPQFKAQYSQVKNLPGKRVVILNVPDIDQYHALALNRTALFTGRFYNQPLTKNVGRISAVKVNALQLLNEVNNPDFELEDIASIIERDPYLTISLLKFINSGAVGLNRQIDSITTAVAIMGQQEVRRWANVAISVSLAEDRPGEIIKLSLVRAKFAENLATAFELGVFQQALFMTGLFSLLDVILQKTMEDAFKEVAVSQKIRSALVDKEGDFYPVMELIYAYERADWDAVSILMIRAGTNVDDVGSAFLNALTWYQQLLQTIDASAEEVEAAEAAEHQGGEAPPEAPAP